MSKLEQNLISSHASIELTDSDNMLGYSDDSDMSSSRNNSWFSKPRGKMLMAVGAVAVVAMVVVLAVVGGTGGFSSSSSSGSSSASTGAQSSNHYYVRSLKDVFNLPEPTSTIANGKAHHTMDFHHVSEHNEVTHYYYRVEHDLNVNSLRRVPEIKEITCADHRITVVFNNSATALAKAEAWVKDSVLILDNRSNCKHLIHRITSDMWTKVENHPVITADSKNITLADIFKVADIQFTSNYTEPVARAKNAQVDTGASGSGSASQTNGRRRRDVWSYLDNMLGNINQDLNYATQALTDLTTGDLTYNNGQLYSHQWNIPITSGSTLNNYLNYNAGATVQLTSAVNINIQDYSLQDFKGTITTSVTVNANANFDAPWSGSWSYGPTAIVPSQTLLAFVLPIGDIDIPVSIDVAAYLAGQLSAQASVTGSAGYQAYGSLEGGVNIGSDLTPQWICNPTYSFTTTQQPQIAASASAQASVVLTPSVSMDISFIGGPQVQAPLSLSSTASIGAESTSMQAQGSLELSAQVIAQVGGDVDIKIADETLYQHTWAPYSFYTHNYQILSKSFTTNL